MKKIKVPLIVCFIALAAQSFVSCSSDEELRQNAENINDLIFEST